MERTEGIENDVQEAVPELEQVKERLRDLNERVIAFIKERPGTCLLAALAAGYLVGRLVRR